MSPRKAGAKAPERRSRRDVMLATPFTKQLASKWSGEYCFAQPKLNGIRAVYRDGHLYSSTGVELLSVPHVLKALEQMERAVGRLPSFDGEIYSHELSFQELSGLARRTADVDLAAASQLNFCVFDIAGAGMQYERFEQLGTTFGLAMDAGWKPEYVSLVPKRHLHLPLKQEELHAYVREQLAKGFEGAVLRHSLAEYSTKRSKDMLKLKPRRCDVYRVHALLREYDKYGDPKNAVGAFLCIDDNSGETFAVGTGPVLTRAYREELWDNMLSLGEEMLFAVVAYPELTARSVPFNPSVIAVGSSPVSLREIYCAQDFLEEF